MNLILKNPIAASDLLDKNFFFDKTRGYISFVETNAIEGMPKVIEIGEKIHPLNIQVIVSKMKGVQALAYENSCQNEGAIYRNMIYSSLFVLPDGEYGENAYLLVNSPETAPHFSESIRLRILKNYQEYSCKMYTAMNIIRSSPGPVFLFCEEVKGSGLIAIAALLEALGYSPYRGENVSSLHIRDRYTIYVGDKLLCPNADERLAGFCSDENIQGEYIKILLGSKISGEGINLRNVRQVHIMTPHWNTFSTKQAIARAIRLDSHLSLQEKERNVSVYRHVAVTSSSQHFEYARSADRQSKSLPKGTQVPKGTDTQDTQDTQQGSDRAKRCLDSSEDSLSTGGQSIDVKADIEDELYTPEKSIDMYKYIISQDKENDILVIKKWMKENSVDRYLYPSTFFQSHQSHQSHQSL
jgi:hypothetical protein